MLELNGPERVFHVLVAVVSLAIFDRWSRKPCRRCGHTRVHTFDGECLHWECDGLSCSIYV